MTPLLLAALFLLSRPEKTSIIFAPSEGRMIGGGERSYAFIVYLAAAGGDLRDPDGPDGITAEAALGTLSPPSRLGQGSYLLRYTPSRVEKPSEGWIRVRVRYKGEETRAEKRFALSPPDITRISIEAQPSPLVLGKDKECRLSILVKDDRGRPMDGLRLEPGASAGSVGDMKGHGGGRYSAKYIPPRERFPQAAIVFVRGEEGLGWTVVPLIGPTSLPLKTKPGSRVIVQVADRKSGPYMTDKEGRVKIPLLVPPGIRTARAAVTDASGNVSEKDIDLSPPPYKRLVLLISPTTLKADGVSAVRALIVTSGKEMPLLEAKGGDAGPPMSVGQGVYEAWLRASSPGRVTVKAFLPGDEAFVEEEEVVASAGPPVRLLLDVEPQRLIADGRSRAAVTIKVLDGMGNGIEGQRVEASSDGGTLERLEEKGGGVYTAWLRSPPKLVSPALGVTARLGVRFPGQDPLYLHSQREVFLSVGKIARIDLTAEPSRLVADGASSTRLILRLSDDVGNPVAGETVTARATAGTIGNIIDAKDGTYTWGMTSPMGKGAGSSTIYVYGRGFSSTTTIALEGKALSVSPKLGYIRDPGYISSPEGEAEARYYLPMLRRLISIGLGLGYYRSSGREGRRDPIIGPYEVDFTLSVIPVSLNAFMELPFLSLFPSIIPYLGAGVGYYISALDYTSPVQGKNVIRRQPLGYQVLGGAEWRMGPGRPFVEGKYSRATFDPGPAGVKGSVGGLSLRAGYRFVF